jgi:signal transduction histidine kinase
MYKDADEILRTVDRASVLTKELTMLSKKQFSEPRHININQEILTLTHSIERITDTNIQLHTHLDQEVHMIKIDPTEFEQVVLNIVINACEAMPSVGDLTLSTSNVVIEDSVHFHPNNTSHDVFVCLSIKDTGKGMDDETQAKMFNPFFTTKVAGKGTGLGLSIVHNIIEQNGGFIDVKSIPGSGTEFLLYFPGITNDRDAKMGGNR